MNKPTVITKTYAEQAKAKIHDIKEGYQGLRISALPGLHDFVFKFTKKLFPTPSKLLDVAAGSGAMTLRLQNLGHQLTACDYVAENFRLHNTTEFYTVDLNTHFSNVIPDTFDGIIAIEIIEHLENPRHFTRELFLKLNPGGYLILTTPNINNPVSIAFFIRRGYFQWFFDENYSINGHLTPIPPFNLLRCLAETGFECIELNSFGDPFIAVKNWPKMRILANLIQLISTTQKQQQGEIFVLIARKPIS